jgi:hypothetical protein
MKFLKRLVSWIKSFFVKEKSLVDRDIDWVRDNFRKLNEEGKLDPYRKKLLEYKQKFLEK